MEQFNIDSDYQKIPIAHFINDSNGNIQILSYNKNMKIEYLRIIYTFISNISNSINEKLDEDLELNTPINSNEFASDNYLREGIIKDYQIKYNLNIDKTSNNSNENELNKIYEKIKLISFIPFTTNNNINMKIKENNKNLSLNEEQLRKLEINLNNSIFFNYSIFEINLNSLLKISLKSYVGLNYTNPYDSHVIIKLFMNVNDKEKVIINKPYKITQFYNISSQINNVFNSISNEIISSLDYIENNLTIFKEEIYSNLNLISNLTSNFTEFFPFQDLTSKINNYFINIFNNLKIYSSEIYYNLSNYINNSESYINKISLIKTNSLELVNDIKFTRPSILNIIYEQIDEIFDQVSKINSDAELDYENVKFYISLLENITNNYLYSNSTSKRINNIKLNLIKLIKLNELNTTKHINNSLNQSLNEIQTNQIIFDNINLTEINEYKKTLELFSDLSKAFYNNLLNIINHNIEYFYIEIPPEVSGLPSNNYITKNVIDNIKYISKINLTNFDIYIDDLNLLNNIQKELQLKRVKSFKIFFIEELKLNKTNLTNSINIETDFIPSGQIDFDFLAQIFYNSINNLTEDIINNIDLKTNLENYYSYFCLDVSESLNLFLNIIQSHSKNYLYYPEELITKLIKIANWSDEIEPYMLINKINTTYINFINCTFSKLYFLVAQEIRQRYHNYMTQDVDSQFIKFINNNYNSYLLNIIEKAKEKIISLDLYSLIQKLEEDCVLNNLNYVINILTHLKFRNIEGIEFFNYQIGNIIEYINNFQNITFDFENIINDTIFDELYSNSYSDDFFKLNNFENISEKIISQFKEFNTNSEEILSNEFKSIINITDIIYNYEILNNDIFVFPFNLLIEIDNHLSASIIQIKKIFGNQISNYLNIYQNITKTFNETNFEILFDNLKSKVNDSYITYQNNYQNYSFIILDDLINYQKKLIEEKCDLLINNINETCLIISSTFCEPNILFIKNLCDNVNEEIKTKFTSISNKQFNSLINEILYKLNESKEILLKTIDNEKNNFISIINSYGKKDYNISNIDDINIIILYFYSNFTNIFSNSSINQYLEKNINNSLNNFTLLSNSSEDFYQKFVENIIDLKKLDVYNIIEYNFNQSIDTFNNYVGFFIFDEFITELLINNICPKIFYNHYIILENFINMSISNLINNKDYRITKNLNNTLYNFYSKIKLLAKNNIESKIEIIIIPKLYEKINEIGELIINEFVSLLIRTWKSEEFKNNFPEEIYNLISLNPKLLINKLNQSYLELMNNKIMNEMIIKINNTIMTNLTIFYEDLDSINNDLITKLQLLELYNVEEEIQNILKSLDNLNNSIYEKDSNISYEIEYDLKSVHETFYNIISSNISKINEFYQNETNNSYSYLKQEFQTFENIDIPSIINSTNNSYFNIMNILKNNIIKNTNDSLSNLEEIDDKIINSNLRRATEYNNKKIDNYINNYTSIYKNFSFEILNNSIYTSLSTIYSNFSNILIDNINDYSNLLKKIYQFEDYKDLDQIIYLYNLFGNETIIFKNTIEDIKNEINIMNIKVENILKEKIDKAFNSIPNILNLFNKINKTKNYQTIENFINYSDNDIINNMITNLIVQNITYKSGYLLYYDKINNNLCFNLEVNANTFIDANNTIDFITERINGELGNAIIGLKVFYSIYNDSTTIEAYFIQNKFNYSSSIIIDNKYANFFNINNNYNLLYYNPELENKIKRTFNYMLS